MATYNAVYYDKLKTESDQKDLLIAQLKAEIFELKQNQKDQAILRQQIANLEARNQTLNEEKHRREQEYNQRADLQQVSIDNMRQDIGILQNAGLQKDNTIKDLRGQIGSLNNLLDQRDQEANINRIEISDKNNQLLLLRDDVKALQGENDKLKGQQRLINSDIDRLTAQNSRLVRQNQETNDKLHLERGDKDRVNRRLVELLDENDRINAEARRHQEALRFTEQNAVESQAQLSNLRSELRDTQLLAERHRQDARNFSRMTEQERLRALRLQQRAQQAEKEKRDKQILAQMHRREAQDARFAKSQILDEKLGQDEELEALREHCSVVTNQNRHLGEQLGRFADQDQLVRSTLNRKDRLDYIRNKNDDELGRSMRKVDLARSRSGSPAKKSPVRRF